MDKFFHLASKWDSEKKKKEAWIINYVCKVSFSKSSLSGSANASDAWPRDVLIYLSKTETNFHALCFSVTSLFQLTRTSSETIGTPPPSAPQFCMWNGTVDCVFSLTIQQVRKISFSAIWNIDFHLNLNLSCVLLCHWHLCST